MTHSLTHSFGQHTRRHWRNLTGVLVVLLSVGTALAQFTELQELLVDPSSGTRFGSRVEVDGSTAVIGTIFSNAGGSSSGTAWVFVNSGGTWSEVATLFPTDLAAGDRFGGWVGISGDTIVVGASRDDDNGGNSGSAYIFVKPAGGWSGNVAESAKLTASDGVTNDAFGNLVAISGDTVVVGATEVSSVAALAGAAYVFVKPAGGWSGNLTEDAKLTASDAAASDTFGRVAISGDTIVVGSHGDDDGGSGSGSAYVYVKPGTGWSGNLTESAKLRASDAAGGAAFGVYPEIDGDVIVVGAVGAGGPGAAYVFVKPGSGWTGALTEDAKLTASDGASGDDLGRGIGISGDTIAVGANRHDINGSDSGAAYVFSKPGTGWNGNLTETLKVNGGDNAAGDRFGFNLGISGGTLMIGALLHDDGGSDAGAVYVFGGCQCPDVMSALCAGLPGLTTLAAAADEVRVQVEAALQGSTCMVAEAEQCVQDLLISLGL